MADPKLSPGVPRTLTGVSPDDSLGAVILRSFAMSAILSSAIGQVRFSESTDGRLKPLFETPLPKPSELLPALDSLHSPQLARDRGFTPGDQQHDNELLLGLAKSYSKRHLLALPEELHARLEAAEAFYDPSRISEDPPETRAIHYLTALAWQTLASDESAATRRAVLDLVFDWPTRSWRADLVTVPEARVQDPPHLLQGEDLEELRRNAALYPPPEPSAPANLPSDAYLSAAAAAELLHVVKSTVTRRIAQNRLIGFPGFTRTLRIPKDQFDRDHVVPGIPDVLALFARSSDGPVDHRAAWTFLNSDLFHGDPDPRPIDRLRAAAATGTTTALLPELARTKESLDRGDHF